MSYHHQVFQETADFPAVVYAGKALNNRDPVWNTDESLVPYGVGNLRCPENYYYEKIDSRPWTDPNICKLFELFEPANAPPKLLCYNYQNSTDCSPDPKYVFQLTEGLPVQCPPGYTKAQTQEYEKRNVLVCERKSS